MSLFCLFVVPCSVMSATDFTTNINSIPMLNGSNFKSWQKNLLIVLTIIDLDLVLKVYSSTPLTDQSTLDDKKEIERWERSNRMCIMIIKKAILEAFKGLMIEKATRPMSSLYRLNKGLSRTKRLKLLCY